MPNLVDGCYFLQDETFNNFRFWAVEIVCYANDHTFHIEKSTSPYVILNISDRFRKDAVIASSDSQTTKKTTFGVKVEQTQQAFLFFSSKTKSVIGWVPGYNKHRSTVDV